jgi:hypothetical protein
MNKMPENRWKTLDAERQSLQDVLAQLRRDLLQTKSQLRPPKILTIPCAEQFCRQIKLIFPIFNICNYTI